MKFFVEDNMAASLVTLDVKPSDWSYSGSSLKAIYKPSVLQDKADFREYLVLFFRPLMAAYTSPSWLFNPTGQPVHD